MNEQKVLEKRVYGVGAIDAWNWGRHHGKSTRARRVQKHIHRAARHGARQAMKLHIEEDGDVEHG